MSKKRKTLGATIAELRKKQGMTQLELAEKMCVTDKAVSKWERDLSCPDVSSLPRLAELLGVSTDELMRGAAPKETARSGMLSLAFKAVAAAMGIAAAVLSVLDALDIRSGTAMLGIGLAALALWALQEKK